MSENYQLKIFLITTWMLELQKKYSLKMKQLNHQFEINYIYCSKKKSLLIKQGLYPANQLNLPYSF